jgi:hypothetical protein
MKGVGIFLIGLLFVSCGYTEKELIGVYAPTDYKNTFDTIQLKEHNKYHRKVYDKNKKLVLEMQGEWNIKEDVIEFKSPYFFNLDRDLVEFPELLQDTASNGLGYVWKKKDTLEFCVGHFAVDLPDQNCYQKLK